jgi:hypothetical protein
MRWQSQSDFKPGQPIYARDINNLIRDTRYWGGNVDAQGNYLLNVSGIEVCGDVNVSGTFRINGVPITAFQERAPNKIIERTIVEKEPRIVQRVIDREIEAGDNVTVERVGSRVTINSDPGDWIEYYPPVDPGAEEAFGQYIVYGPICFVQMYIKSMMPDKPMRISLPFVGCGPVKQSLNFGIIEEGVLIVEPTNEAYINGAYRIA